MKKILVVGGAGFIGSRLVPELQRRGHNVIVADLYWFMSSQERLKLSPNYLTMDAVELSQIVLSTFDAVIFLAGLSNDPMAEFDPLQNFIANGSTPAYLAEMSRRAGVKTFIHGGSCSVYGFTDFVDESAVPTTFSPYGVSKLMGELGVLQQRNNMRVICFRMGTVAGWSPRMRFDLVVNAMVKSAMTRGEITVNDGAAHRPILDIIDAVNAYVHAVEDDRVSGVINLASENTTVARIAIDVQTTLRRAEGQNATIVNVNTKDIRSYSVSTARASRLGFGFFGSVRRAAVEVMTNFKRIENPEDDRYYNIRTFKKFTALKETQVAAQ